jgi:membrane-bound serine protease (ClpP class)
LLGAGILLLFIEFKSSTFGLLGFIGVGLLVLVFVSSYVAGLAGYEPLLLFALGLVLIAIEIFVLPGSLACGFFGSLCFFCSFVWAMLDVWPSEYHFGLTPESFIRPLFNIVFGFALAILGFAMALRFLPKTRLFGSLVNDARVPPEKSPASSGAATATGATTLPDPGTRGVAVTDLRPLGEIEIAGGRYQARAVQGQIDRGASIEVVSRKDFAISVKRAT